MPATFFFWLLDRGEDLTSPRLWLDRAWMAPDGTLRTSLSLADLLDAAAAYRHMFRQLGVRPGNVVVIRIASPIDVYLRHQRIKAQVTPADVDVNALRRFCEERLSPSKRPHDYEAIAALATTPSGKVIRGAHGKA